MAKTSKTKQETPKDDIEAELLLRDAEAELQKDKLNALWDEWGSTIIGVALMLIFGTMLGVGWRGWRDAVHSEQTAILVNASTVEAELSPFYKGIQNLTTGEKLSQTPAILHQLMIQAADAGLPKEWDILAEWAKLRTEADLEATADKNAIANKMIELSSKRKNPYAPAILMEAALIKGENGDVDAALPLLKQALEMEATKTVPALEKSIKDYILLYELEQKS
jgi:hypothetical protein